MKVAARKGVAGAPPSLQPVAIIECLIVLMMVIIYITRGMINETWLKHGPQTLPGICGGPREIELLRFSRLALHLLSINLPNSTSRSSLNARRNTTCTYLS